MSKIKELNINTISSLSKKTGMQVSDRTFCVLPFSHLSTTTTGELRLCCRSKAIGHISETSLLELWKSDKLNKIRNKLIKGERIKECNKCWEAEDSNITSLREGQNVARGKHYIDQILNYKADKDLKLPSLELKLSNRCNLRCHMCSPAASNRWVNQWQSVSEYFEPNYQHWVQKIIKKNDLMKSKYLDVFSKNTTFKTEIKEIAKTIHLLDFAGGEPLIDPLHYEFLENIIRFGKPEETVLRYSTNLTVLAFEKFSVKQLWNKFKNVELTISIDGHESLNDYIRNGSNSEVILKNIELVKQIKKIKSIKCTTTVSAYNAPFISEIADYIINKLNCTWHSSRVTSPDFLDARVWPKEYKEYFIRKAELYKPERYITDSRSLMQANRHLNDFKAWMSSSYDSPLLMKKFIGYTKSLDNNSDKKFLDFFKPEDLLELPGLKSLWGIE